MQTDFYEPPTPTMSAFAIRGDSPAELQRWAELMFAGFDARIVCRIARQDVHIQTFHPDGVLPQ